MFAAEITAFELFHACLCFCNDYCFTIDSLSNLVLLSTSPGFFISNDVVPPCADVFACAGMFFDTGFVSAVSIIWFCSFGCTASTIETRRLGDLSQVFGNVSLDQVMQLICLVVPFASVVGGMCHGFYPTPAHFMFIIALEELTELEFPKFFKDVVLTTFTS